ncbi:MAG: hypothetical protein JNM84_08495 [Planctomycetes bacterium]|nr:hypothetical protein [Planctomycetota bacterium]
MLHLPALLCLALLSPAQDDLTTYQLKPNPKGLREVRAKVLAVEDTRARLRGVVNGETREGWVDLKWFTDVSALRVLKSAASSTDAASQVRIARFALSTGNLAEAEKAWAAAVQANGGASPDRAMEKALASQRANALESRFHEEVYAGKVDAAERTLAKLLKEFPDSGAAKKAPALRQQLDTKRQMAAAEVARAKAEKVETKRERLLAPAREKIAQATAAEQRSLSDRGTETQAKNASLSSVRSADAALATIDRATKQMQGDAELATAATALRSEALTVRKRSLLNLGSYSLTRGQYHNALGYVNGILRYAPSDADALGMRARIETAANEDADWWGGVPTVVGRTGRVVPHSRR